MRRVLAALALLWAGAAFAQTDPDFDQRQRCQAGDCITMLAQPKNGNLTLSVTASSKASPIVQIVIASAKGGPLARCNASTCVYVWLASKMAANEAYSVTATRQDGRKLQIIGTVARPGTCFLLDSNGGFLTDGAGGRLTC